MPLVAEFKWGMGNTVPYGSLYDEVRRNNGFVDLRRRPDLALTIAEGDGSDALRSILIALARPDSPLFSVGCDLGHGRIRRQPKHLREQAGGYIQLVASDYRSPSATAILKALAETARRQLDEASGDEVWLADFVMTEVQLNLDNYCDLTVSLWVWFHAQAANGELAIASRERLLCTLHSVLVAVR